MLRPDQMALRGTAIRDQVVAFALDHERQDHGGEVCASNRASIVAYLIHSLGFKADSAALWSELMDQVRGYERRCKGDCGHEEIG